MKRLQSKDIARRGLLVFLQEQQEAREFREQMKKDRLEERKARQRIKEQIAQDRCVLAVQYFSNRCQRTALTVEPFDTRTVESTGARRSMPQPTTESADGTLSGGSLPGNECKETLREPLPLPTKFAPKRKTWK